MHGVNLGLLCIDCVVKWSEMYDGSFINYFLGEEHFISMFLHFAFFTVQHRI